MCHRSSMTIPCYEIAIFDNNICSIGHFSTQNKSGNTYVLHAKFQNVLFQMAFHEQTLMMRPTWRCRCRIGCKESTLIGIYQKEKGVTLYFISYHSRWVFLQGPNNFYIASIVTLFNCRPKDKKRTKQKWRIKSRNLWGIQTKLSTTEEQRV